MQTEILIQLAFELTGGLGIFLLGMKNMSEGMQAVAGNSLRKMIGAVTNNRLMATGLGVLVTCIVQSSSITTVMVVGLVNSGVMQLGQAIGVIMGANIGTTITGWILVLKIGKYGLPILGAAAFVHLFARGDRWRYWAMALMGVGMIFFGLELMKDACAHIKELPDFEHWFQRFAADSYFGVLRCALVGCVLTMLVQSSSATLGITISLATEGVIGYETAAALVLGENIGTTITAYLASLGATTNARRAAYFHVIFNLLGVFWITLIFPWYIEFIREFVVPNVNEPATQEGLTVYPHRTAAIAATHSIFNIANTLLFLPFAPMFARLLERLVPGKGFKEKPHLTDLNIHMLETPVLAIEQSQNEILKMGSGASNMMDWLKTLMEQEDYDRKLVDRLLHRERVFDAVQDEVSHFIAGLLSNNVPLRVAEEGRAQLRMADEYESVGDYIASILKADTKLRKDEQRMPEDLRKQLLTLHDRVASYLLAVDQANHQQNRNILAGLDGDNRQIRNEIKRLRKLLLDKLSAGEISPAVSVAFMGMLNSYTRVRDHAKNIAELISGEK